MPYYIRSSQIYFTEIALITQKMQSMIDQLEKQGLTIKRSDIHIHYRDGNIIYELLSLPDINYY